MSVKSTFLAVIAGVLTALREWTRQDRVEGGSLRGSRVLRVVKLASAISFAFLYSAGDHFLLNLQIENDDDVCVFATPSRDIHLRRTECEGREE